MPETEALLPRFRAAHTQVLGVSVDSTYCHAHWGESLGGISFPLLSDFQPKGAVAAALGLYLEAAGITDRATVIIDKDGVVQYVHSVGPQGRRDIAELASACEKIDASNRGADLPAGKGLASGSVLYVRSNCGASRAAAAARCNLHLDDLMLKNVSRDANAMKELEKVAGKGQAPCLVMGGEVMHEAAAIVSFLAKETAPIQ